MSTSRTPDEQIVIHGHTDGPELLGDELVDGGSSFSSSSTILLKPHHHHHLHNHHMLRGHSAGGECCVGFFSSSSTTPSSSSSSLHPANATSSSSSSSSKTASAPTTNRFVSLVSFNSSAAFGGGGGGNVSTSVGDDGNHQTPIIFFDVFDSLLALEQHPTSPLALVDNNHTGGGMQYGASNQEGEEEEGIGMMSSDDDYEVEQGGTFVSLCVSAISYSYTNSGSSSSSTFPAAAAAAAARRQNNSQQAPPNPPLSSSESGGEEVVEELYLTAPIMRRRQRTHRKRASSSKAVRFVTLQPQGVTVANAVLFPSTDPEETEDVDDVSDEIANDAASSEAAAAQSWEIVYTTLKKNRNRRDVDVDAVQERGGGGGSEEGGKNGNNGDNEYVYIRSLLPYSADDNDSITDDNNKNDDDGASSSSTDRKKKGSGSSRYWWLGVAPDEADGGRLILVPPHLRKSTPGCRFDIQAVAAGELAAYHKQRRQKATNIDPVTQLDDDRQQRKEENNNGTLRETSQGRNADTDANENNSDRAHHDGAPGHGTAVWKENGETNLSQARARKAHHMESSNTQGVRSHSPEVTEPTFLTGENNTATTTGNDPKSRGDLNSLVYVAQPTVNNDMILAASRSPSFTKSYTNNGGGGGSGETPLSRSRPKEDGGGAGGGISKGTAIPNLEKYEMNLDDPVNQFHQQQEEQHFLQQQQQPQEPTQHQQRKQIGNDEKTRRRNQEHEEEEKEEKTTSSNMNPDNCYDATSAPTALSSSVSPSLEHHDSSHINRDQQENHQQKTSSSPSRSLSSSSSSVSVSGGRGAMTRRADPLPLRKSKSTATAKTMPSDATTADSVSTTADSVSGTGDEDDDGEGRRRNRHRAADRYVPTPPPLPPPQQHDTTSSYLRPAKSAVAVAAVAPGLKVTDTPSDTNTSTTPTAPTASADAVVGPSTTTTAATTTTSGGSGSGVGVNVYDVSNDLPPRPRTRNPSFFKRIEAMNNQQQPTPHMTAMPESGRRINDDNNVDTAAPDGKTAQRSNSRQHNNRPGTAATRVMTIGVVGGDNTFSTPSPEPSSAAAAAASTSSNRSTSNSDSTSSSASAAEEDGDVDGDGDGDVQDETHSCDDEPSSPQLVVATPLLEIVHGAGAGASAMKGEQQQHMHNAAQKTDDVEAHYQTTSPSKATKSTTAVAVADEFHEDEDDDEKETYPPPPPPAQSAVEGGFYQDRGQHHQQQQQDEERRQREEIYVSSSLQTPLGDPHSAAAAAQGRPDGDIDHEEEKIPTTTSTSSPSIPSTTSMVFVPWGNAVGIGVERGDGGDGSGAGHLPQQHHHHQVQQQAKPPKIERMAAVTYKDTALFLGGAVGGGGGRGNKERKKSSQSHQSYDYDSLLEVSALHGSSGVWSELRTYTEDPSHRPPPAIGHTCTAVIKSVNKVGGQEQQQQGNKEKNKKKQKRKDHHRNHHGVGDCIVMFGGTGCSEAVYILSLPDLLWTAVFASESMQGEGFRIQKGQNQKQNLIQHQEDLNVDQNSHNNPHYLQYHTAVASLQDGENVYVFGGINGHLGLSKRMYRFHVPTRRWHIVGAGGGEGMMTVDLCLLSQHQHQQRPPAVAAPPVSSSSSAAAAAATIVPADCRVQKHCAQMLAIGRDENEEEEDSHEKVADKEFMVIFGGYNSMGVATNSISVYDPKGNIFYHNIQEASSASASAPASERDVFSSQQQEGSRQHQNRNRNSSSSAPAFSIAGVPPTPRAAAASCVVSSSTSSTAPETTTTMYIYGGTCTNENIANSRHGQGGGTNEAVENLFADLYALTLMQSNNNSGSSDYNGGGGMVLLWQYIDVSPSPSSFRSSLMVNGATTASPAAAAHSSPSHSFPLPARKHSGLVCLPDFNIGQQNTSNPASSSSSTQLMIVGGAGWEPASKRQPKGRLGATDTIFLLTTNDNGTQSGPTASTTAKVPAVLDASSVAAAEHQEALVVYEDAGGDDEADEGDVGGNGRMVGPNPWKKKHHQIPLSKNSFDFFYDHSRLRQQQTSRGAGGAGTTSASSGGRLPSTNKPPFVRSVAAAPGHKDIAFEIERMAFVTKHFHRRPSSSTTTNSTPMRLHHQQQQHHHHPSTAPRPPTARATVGPSPVPKSAGDADDQTSKPAAPAPAPAAVSLSIEESYHNLAIPRPPRFAKYNPSHWGRDQGCFPPMLPMLNPSNARISPTRVARLCPTRGEMLQKERQLHARYIANYPDAAAFDPSSNPNGPTSPHHNAAAAAEMNRPHTSPNNSKRRTPSSTANTKLTNAQMNEMALRLCTRDAEIRQARLDKQRQQKEKAENEVAASRIAPPMTKGQEENHVKRMYDQAIQRFHNKQAKLERKYVYEPSPPASPKKIKRPTSTYSK